VRPEPDRAADQDRHHHHQAEAPPGEPDHRREDDGHQNPGGDAEDPLQTVLDRLVEGQLHDQQRGQRRQHRLVARTQGVGEHVRQHRGEGGLRRPQAGTAATAEEGCTQPPAQPHRPESTHPTSQTDRVKSAARSTGGPTGRAGRGLSADRATMHIPLCRPRWTAVRARAALGLTGWAVLGWLAGFGAA
jgi:hypothetical protein